MKPEKTIVLKFGSSVLRTADDAPRAAHEVYRWVREGWRVVAVVSALEGETDALLSHARQWDRVPHAGATALLASTGELRSAAILTLALDRAGIDSHVADVAAIGFRTVGSDLMDAQPERIDVAKLRRLLQRTPVVVLPGFLGRDFIGRTTLLGRGGSDCSALFLADQLQARCRLIKDVDGLYEWDPGIPGKAPRRYRQLDWDSALRLDGGIVQHKAIELAKGTDQSFEVAGLYQRTATRVGRYPVELAELVENAPPLRVVILGLGTVGRGVYDALIRLPQSFQVVAAAVRNRSRAEGIPSSLVQADLASALEVPCDVVVESIGDPDPALRAIRHALGGGVSVVTANKRVVAQFGDHLESLAREHGTSILWSAAVGGAVPLLEQIAGLSAKFDPVSIHAVLNGTTNYVLDRWQSGATWTAALEEARSAGFAEADPSRDLDGSDAADKLVLIHRQITGRWMRPGQVARESLDVQQLDSWEVGSRPTIRQVASWIRRGSEFRLRVAYVVLSNQHPLARLQRAENGALIRTSPGKSIFVRGKGAGCWPTTESVVADLFDLRDRSSRASLPIENQAEDLEWAPITV